jgi:hypothetical protein
MFAACGGETPSGSGGAGGGSGGAGGGSGGAGGGSGGAGGGTGGSGGSIPAMITVSGVADDVSITGRSPLAGVTIGVYREGENNPVATATSDSAGMYSLTIATNGMALSNGYLLGKKSGYKDTYLYPPTDLSADTPNVPVLMLTPTNYDLASTLGGANQQTGQAFIGIQLYDASKNPVAGATITSNPAGQVRYNANGVPSRNPSSSASDGIGYIFQVTPGSVMVSASKSGLSFHTHTINARADVLTTTIIQP